MWSTCWGRLGNRFRLPTADEVAAAGAVGSESTDAVPGRSADGSNGIAFCGAFVRDLLPLTVTGDGPAAIAGFDRAAAEHSRFARHGVRAVITTDDGSFGFRGFVTQAVEGYLDVISELPLALASGR